MPNTDLLLHIIGLSLLMVCSAFFSGSETAFSALSDGQMQRIRTEKLKGLAYVIRFLDEPRRLFITVLFGNTLVNVAFVSLVGSLVYYQLFGGRDAWLASLVAVVIQLSVLLILGEMTPKIYAIKHAESFFRLVSLPLWGFSVLIFPIRRVLRLVTDLTVPLFGVQETVRRRRVTREELRAMVTTAQSEGALSERESEIIRNIVDLNDIEAREAMVPRTEMACLEVSMTIREAFDLAHETGFSRLPVFRKDIDNMCGLFYVKDLPVWIEGKDPKVDIDKMTIDEFLTQRAALSRENPEKRSSLVRRPYFALESKNIGALMRDMTRGKYQMALLLDEYGGIAGLITMEDMVEEVVGEIMDEYDLSGGQSIVRLKGEADTFEVPGLTSLRTINKKLKLRLDRSQADSVGGYVGNLFGAIPKVGDRIEDQAQSVQFEIINMDGPRIDRVKVKKSGETGGAKSAVSVLLLGLLLVPLLPLLATASAGATAHATEGLFVPVFLAILLVSLVLNAFYSGAETAVVSASREKLDVLAEDGNISARTIRGLLDAPEKLLGTVLVGTNLMVAMSGQAGLMLAGKVFPDNQDLQSLLNTVVMTLLILVFGDILPKTVFHAKADTLCLRSAGLLKFSSTIFAPAVGLVTGVTNFMTNSGQNGAKQEKLRITRDELSMVATMGTREGGLKEDQLEMIQSVLDLEDRPVERVMVPLVNVVAVPKTATLEEFFEKAIETGYSRIAVFEDRIDNLVGVVNILDVLYAKPGGSTILPFVRQDITYEPKSRHVLSLLPQLQQSRKPMAFVVDEYGGVIGLVTSEDLIEEITGEILDEDDVDESEYVRRISENIIECDGRTEIDELNRSYELDVPEGDYETIAGYVSTLMQRIPKQGESFETDTLRIMVVDAGVRRIRRLRIQKMATPDGADER